MAIDIKELEGLFNARFNQSYTQNYYWDYEMNRTQIYSRGIAFTIGLKAGFRL